ncbi:uncharacterized protein BJ171DRAFT_503012 [Polychytrium aggregatum]|uniref:uncharacterized protein n=1 Tax=Polychytrium aggregatum TaxID=110093 RepID=UPI0022FDE80A|nr:uncharacterized protein BJ171DRAFT_503012 [Polychytrium aggregatum]KAI9205106.1 hypothetical protein BJ171DRAFT_503012 [Polychytrium aggregatum]
MLFKQSVLSACARARTQALRQPMPAMVPVRLSHRKSPPPPKHWTKRGIDESILNSLCDAAKVAEEQVYLDSNYARDLLLDQRDRYEFFLQTCDEFQIPIEFNRRLSQDHASGRETSDWVAAQMEQQGRLTF